MVSYVLAVSAPPIRLIFRFLGDGCVPFQPRFKTFHVVLARDDCRMAVYGGKPAALVIYAKIYINYVMYRE